MVDIASAYLAFLANNPHNQNSRFIEEKLDEILVGKVMESGLTNESVSFSSILKQIDRVSEHRTTKGWLRNENNLIGFALGCKKSFSTLSKINTLDFAASIDVFESAFQSINPSKVNVGKYRRELSSYFVANIKNLIHASEEELREKFFELTAN